MFFKYGLFFQEGKERLQKKPLRDIKIFLKKKKKKIDNMVANAPKIFQKMKKINWLSIEQNIIKCEKKHFITIIRKHFNLENFLSS